MTIAAAEDMRIATLAQQYAVKTRTPADVLEGVLARVAAAPRKGIWINVLAESQIHAQLAWVEAQHRAGRPLPLYGIPFAIKDNIDLAGVPTTAACPAFAYTPDRSAPVVQRLLDAGAIPVGKTNMDQFATGLVGTRSPYGICENAFDPAYISGGSSSGSAVAIAMNQVSFSLGTDTAGSGRVPASFNNIVGLKPTRGLLSTRGVVPACRSLDCVSIFAHSCAEAETIYRITAADDPEHPLSRTSPPLSPEPKTLRVGVPAAGQLTFFKNHAAAALYQKAVERVQALGVEIVTIDFDPFRNAADLLYDGPWLVERLQVAGTLLEKNPELLRPEFLAVLSNAHKFTAAEVFEAAYLLAGLRRRADEQWSRMDVLLLPTTGTIYTIAEIQADPLRLNRNLGTYTNFVNLLDLSALAVPNGFLPSGLPMGITFIAPAFQDAQLLSLGTKFHALITQGATP